MSIVRLGDNQTYHKIRQSGITVCGKTVDRFGGFSHLELRNNKWQKPNKNSKHCKICFKK
jgi:hypothetical protein